MTRPVMQATCAHGAPIIATARDESRPVVSIAADGCVAWHVPWTERHATQEAQAREWSGIARATCDAIAQALGASGDALDPHAGAEHPLC